MFRRVLSMLLDRTLSATIRTHLLCFLIHAFQSLDCDIVRKECAPLVSIGIWHNFSTEQWRDKQLDQVPQLKKAWRAATKRYEAADDSAKAKLRFERSWLYSLLLDFLSLLYSPTGQGDTVSLQQLNDAFQANLWLDQTVYCERFLEFLIDLQSQLPTRRYVNALLRDLHLLPAMSLSPMYNDEENGLLRDLHSLLSHYMYFAIDDQTGIQYTRSETYDRHCALLGRLQRIALKHFKEKLTILALSNYAAMDKREELRNLLEPLTDKELFELANLLDLRTTYPESLKIQVDRKFLLEVFLTTYERRKSFQEKAQNMTLVPTEESLFDTNFQRADAYDGSRPLALPKLNLQYLSLGDFLWRALILYRCESFYGIRRDVETALRRLRPESKRAGETHFGGFSKMAIPISHPA